jgi:hypothetical protein
MFNRGAKSFMKEVRLRNRSNLVCYRVAIAKPQEEAEASIPHPTTGEMECQN